MFPIMAVRVTCPIVQKIEVFQSIYSILDNVRIMSSLFFCSGGIDGGNNDAILECIKTTSMEKESTVVLGKNKALFENEN